MQRALARHEAGEAIVIPVILRPCDWHGTPFGKLLATPTDGKPVTQFPDRDQAMLEVAVAVRSAAGRLGAPASEQVRATSGLISVGPPTASRALAGPRSSNLSLARTFSDRDKDIFKHQSFEYIRLYFQNSLVELSQRNPDIEGDVRLIDATRFTAAIYVAGKAISRCTIFMGDRMFANGIAYAHGETSSTSSLNELVTVEADDQSLFLRSMGMSSMDGRTDSKLSEEGAAEHYWTMLIRPLQPR